METNRTSAVRPTVCILILALHSTALSKIIYVDDDTTGLGNGSSWAEAYRFLQDALADAKDSAKPVEIRVAQGLYRPDQRTNQTAGSRGATFELIDGVVVKGGYAGVLTADPDLRDVDKYTTVLSGDLLGNDAVVGHPQDLRREATRSDNSEHVVTGVGVTATAILDGFVIVGGRYARISRNGISSGGPGVFLSAASPTLLNCRFHGNYVYAGSGGALFNSNGSQPQVANCIFSGNFAPLGGAICNQDNSHTMIVDCKFYDNCAARGGALGNLSSAAHVSNCIFVGNRATYGGAIYNGEGGYALVANCTLHANHAAAQGGAIWTRSVPRLVNLVTNCIVQGNSPDQILLVGPGTIVSYCNITGGWLGEGNFDAEPRFVQPGHWADSDNANQADDPNDRNSIWIDGDYHLKSQAGRLDPVSMTWVRDDVTSPCIDTGDPNNPIGYEPFPNGGRVNMGAYGGTAGASKSYFGKPVCETVIAGDINGDCRVDFRDLQIMARHWLQEQSE